MCLDRAECVWMTNGHSYLMSANCSSCPPDAVRSCFSRSSSRVDTAPPGVMVAVPPFPMRNLLTVSVAPAAAIPAAAIPTISSTPDMVPPVLRC